MSKTQFNVGDRVRYNAGGGPRPLIRNGEGGIVVAFGGENHGPRVRWDRGRDAWLPVGPKHIGHAPHHHASCYLEPAHDLSAGYGKPPPKLAMHGTPLSHLTLTLTPVEAIALRDLLGQAWCPGPDPLDAVWQALHKTGPIPIPSTPSVDIPDGIRWTPANVDSVTRRATDWVYSTRPKPPLTYPGDIR